MSKSQRSKKNRGGENPLDSALPEFVIQRLADAVRRNRIILLIAQWLVEQAYPRNNGAGARRPRRPARSVGEVQRKLDAAREHFNHAWGALRREGRIPWDWGREEPKFAVGSVEYHLRAAESYVQECIEGMYQFIGSTEGQLCPCDDCAHDLAIESAGWCRCGHCRRPFYAEESDGDFEDYHVRRPRPGESVPEALLLCRDLGPSWATPQGSEE
ncbi:MAG: hypothetical protein L0332_23545 [Chloroflexi bacterium]|nr:hypothetical protein [Chloroflexota bacterium]